MLKQFVLFAAVAYARAANSAEDGVTPGSRNTSCACGWANRGMTRIVGGSFYDPNTYPFVAGLARIKPSGEYPAFCGGSIITPNHVITAAHCTVNVIQQGTPIVVLLGTHNRTQIDNKAQIIKVQAIRQHEQYDASEIRYDISIVILAQSINFNMIIGPVCLPLPRLDVTGKTVKVIGWGAEKYGGPVISAPKELDTTVVPLAVCEYYWGGMVSSSVPTQLCTQSTRESACQGDSGGPVVYLDPQTNRYTLVGIVSYGLHCTDERPVVNTKVEAFLYWILETVAYSKPSPTCFKVPKTNSSQRYEALA